VKLQRILIASVVFLGVGFSFLWSHWNGSASFNGALPAAGTKFEFCGSASGGSVLVGLPLILVGIVLLLLATGFAIDDEIRKPRPKLPNV
jgi:hypothetical protein